LPAGAHLTRADKLPVTPDLGASEPAEAAGSERAGAIEEADRGDADFPYAGVPAEAGVKTAGFPDPAAGPYPVAVVPLGLSETTSERYPQLAERNVGLGVHNMLDEHLQENGKFHLVEADPEILDLIDRYWVAGAASDPSAAVHQGRLRGARFVIYGEVFKFSTRKLGHKRAEAEIAIQIKLVDVETLEYVPAHGTSARQRTVKRGEIRMYPDGSGDVAFARSLVGEITDEALGKAVATLLERWEQRVGEEDR
jgi:curli biogenesis system outer membrane secretion channel CsgG